MSEVFDIVLICDGCGERVVVESSVMTATGCGSGYECHCGVSLDAVENDLSNPLRTSSLGALDPSTSENPQI